MENRDPDLFLFLIEWIHKVIIFCLGKNRCAMNRSCLAMVFMALSFTGKATTYTGDVLLADVAELRDFFDKYPGVDSIFGNLVVSADLEDSTDWKPLEQIKLVSGHMELHLVISREVALRFELEQVGALKDGLLQVHFENKAPLKLDFPYLRQADTIRWSSKNLCVFTGGHLVKKAVSIAIDTGNDMYTDSLGFFRGLEELVSLKLHGRYQVHSGFMPSLVKLDSFSLSSGYLFIDDRLIESIFPNLNGRLHYLNFNAVYYGPRLQVLKSVHTFILNNCYGLNHYDFPNLRDVYYAEIRGNESKSRSFDSLAIQHGGTFIYENIDLGHEGLGYLKLPDTLETFDVWSANIDPLKVESDRVKVIKNFRLRGGLKVKKGPALFPNWVVADSVALDSISINTELFGALNRVNHSIQMNKARWDFPEIFPSVTSMGDDAQVLMNYNTVSNGNVVNVLPHLKEGQLRKVSYVENQSNGYYVFLPVFGEGQDDCSVPAIDSLDFGTRSVHDNLNFRCLKNVGSVGHVTARFFPQDPTWFYDFLCPLINQEIICSPERMEFYHTNTGQAIPLAPLLEQCTGVVGIGSGIQEQTNNLERLQQAMRERPVPLRLFTMGGQLLWNGTINKGQWEATLENASGSVLIVVSPEFGSFKIYH